MSDLTPTAIDREIDDLTKELLAQPPALVTNGDLIDYKYRIKQLLRQVTDEVIGEDEPDRFATRNRLRKQQRHHRDKLLGEEN